MVERIVETEHSLTECAERVMASPAACRRVLHELARLAREGALTSEPKWRSTWTAADGLTNGIHEASKY